MGKYIDTMTSVGGKIKFRTALVADLQCSIARDCLQAERSLLQYCKFAGVLGFASLAVLLDYRFGDLQGHSDSSSFSSAKKFSTAVGVIFFCLSIGSLSLGIFNYYNNVYHYVNDRTKTGSRIPTNVFLTLVVVALLAVNVSILVDAYR